MFAGLGGEQPASFTLNFVRTPKDSLMAYGPSRGCLVHCRRILLSATVTGNIPDPHPILRLDFVCLCPCCPLLNASVRVCSLPWLDRALSEAGCPERISPTSLLLSIVLLSAFYPVRDERAESQPSLGAVLRVPTLLASHMF
jgi:hypothetical protein